ncbi:phage tail protein I [Campylobacter blaseri]|uniref:Phage tail protein I n=1 Tax=Campylobacter blaseri TaxID=2042961 RepID=A0A2P8QYP1_9BACT|nr:phage tail protein I [Campylobacter blaseri]PSM51364.1 phage tail protein I [Campylobacter blaseri]PSM52814.1 phage tail protein I [Campylobacter blaseri]QKF86115.1 phage tail protein I [Campylobacter blaseri]
MSHILPNHKAKIDKKFDELFGLRFDELNINVINTLAYKCPSKLLPILAKSFDVSIAGLNEKNARELIFNAFEIHYYSGTIYSLSKALKSFFGDSKVIEWFDYKGKPYHFKVELDISKHGLLKEDYEKIDGLIEEYKNVRSVLGGITLISKNKGVEFNALATLSGEITTIYPFVLRNLNTHFKNYYALALIQTEIYKTTILKSDPMPIKIYNLAHKNGLLSGELKGVGGNFNLIINDSFVFGFERSNKLEMMFKGVVKDGNEFSVVIKDSINSSSKYRVIANN